MKENLNYKVKIDVPNIAELISETFDGVLDCMLPEMLVFGGALRDIIAGFGLHYDLDIAASQIEGEKFIHYLESSSKWVEEYVVTQYKEQAKTMRDKTLDIISPHSMKNGILDLDRDISHMTRPKTSNYNNNVRTFINSSGRKLQIIMNKSNLFTPDETSPISIVKTVDFICCGIIMDTNGNAYEIIEGAKDDCIKRILRINENTNVEVDKLNRRIKKFVARGWKSEINLTKIKYKQARLKRSIEKRKTNNLKEQPSYIFEHTLLDGRKQLVINTSKMQTFKHCNGASGKTLRSFHNILKKHDLNRVLLNCLIDLSCDSHNQIIISVTGKNTPIMSMLKKTLLYQEHYSTLNQMYKIDILESENISKLKGKIEVSARFPDYKTHSNKYYGYDDLFSVSTDAIISVDCSPKKVISVDCSPKKVKCGLLTKKSKMANYARDI